MKTVAFITIRLNSKRLPRKNILPLGEHPLSWYVCNTMLKCQQIDEIYVYCSDDSIMNYVPNDSRLIFLKRDEYLDGDLIRAPDTYSAFVNDINADIYIAGLTTAPFVRSESIDAGITAVKTGEYDSAFAARKLQSFLWYQGKPLNYSPESIARTQDIEPVIMETSGFFVFTRQLWQNHKRRIGFKPFVVEVDEIEAVDIDTQEDFDFANIIVKSQLLNKKAKQ